MFICDISVLNKYGKQKLDEMLIPFMQTDKGNVTRILQSMKTRGMIYRKSDTKDQRNKLCYLTNESFKLLPELKRILKQWEEECFSGLTKEEIIICRKINEIITKNLVGEWK